jgi:hypothetical protein
MKRLLILFSFILAGSSLPTLKYRAVDNSGIPLSGAKLYFYTHGTPTPKATYSNEALSTANANPVVADSHGWFGEIYLNTDDAYKVVLKTSSGVTMWTLDNINAASLASGLSTRLKQVASNPLDYGAVGDGVADESAAVQSAITNATSTVDLLGKTYRCDTTLTVKSGVTIKNGTLDFSASSSNTYISILGTIGTPVALDADATVGAVVLSPVSATGFADGDWIYVESGDSWAGSSTTYGEIYRIESIASSDFTLDRSILGHYTYTTAPGIYKISPVSHVRLENLSIIASPSGSGTGDIVNLKYATDIRITDVRMDGVKGSGVVTAYVSDVRIDKLSITGGASTSLGVYVRDASRDVTLTNSTIVSTLYGIYAYPDPASNDGIITGLTVSNNSFDRCGRPIKVFIQAYGVLLDNNIIMGSASGETAILVLTSNATISNNTIKDCLGYGIHLDPYTPSDGVNDRLVVSNNAIMGCNKGIKYEDGATPLTALDALNIVGNHINVQDVSVDAIYIEEASNALTHPIVEVTVADNQIYGTFADGIHTLHILRQDIHDNYIGSSTAAVGIYAHEPKLSINIAGNYVVTLASGATYAIGLGSDTSNAPVMSIHDNSTITTCRGLVATADVAGVELNISNNSFISVKQGISVISATNALSRFSLVGNTVAGTTGASYPTVEMTGAATVGVISGNIFTRTDTAAAVLKIDADSGGLIHNLSIVGNTLSGGTYSIDSDATLSNISHNNMVGYSTSTVTGVNYTTETGLFVNLESTATCANEGTGAAGALTVTPTTSYILLADSDPHGCNITMSETGAQTGEQVQICFTGSNSATFIESGGVLALTGSFPFVMSAGDCLTLLYHSSQWNEVGRAPETPQILVAGALAVDVPADGTGAAATYTLLPTKSFVALTCADTDNCTMSMSESTVATGELVTICMAGSNTSSFSESAGVLALEGGSPYAMVAGDCLSLVYYSGQWNEISRKMETPPTDRQYSFMATTAADYAYSTGDTIVHDTDRYDNGSWHNTTTGVATIPVSGVYTFTAWASLERSGFTAQLLAGEEAHLAIYSDYPIATTLIPGSSIAASSTNLTGYTLTVSYTGYFTATSEVSVKIYHTHTGTLGVDSGSDLADTGFSGILAQ